MSNWFEFEGHRIWYLREGVGEPILFLHHGEADHRLWDYQVAHFRQTHEVLAPDLLGFGHSDKPDVAYTLDVFVRLLERCIDELQLAPVILVGACVGSAMALQYAYEHPRQVRALVLINTLTAQTLAAGTLDQTTSRVQRRLPRALVRLLVRRGLIPRRQRELWMRLAFGDTVDEQWAAYFNEQRWRDRRAILTWVSMGEHTTTYMEPRPDKPEGFPPVCSIWGSANRILPAAAGRKFCEILRPDEEHVIAGAGHMAPLERPEAVNAIIESFLRRLAPAATGSVSALR